MDPSDFPGSLGPLSLPDKPLIGDLPSDMEFGEDLLASQTASVPQGSALQPQEMEWETPKQATSGSALDLGSVKTDALPHLSKSNSLGPDKSGTLDILEKPDVLDSLSKDDELVSLDKPMHLGRLYKEGGSEDPEDGPGDCSAPAAEALVPEAWKEDGVSKADSEDPKDNGAESMAFLPDSRTVASPEVVEVTSTPVSQEVASSPGSSPATQRVAKKARLKGPRRSSPVRKEEASTEASGEPVLNSTPESVGESPAEAEKDSSSTGPKEPATPRAQQEPVLSPSLPGA